MNSDELVLNAQKAVCKKYDADFMEAKQDLKLGIAENVKNGLVPLNGLRINPAGDATGWYIWAGEELSKAPDFFVPLHVEHIDDWAPGVKKYLGLAPGWRFLIAGDYEDVWYDPEILEDE